jgi:hypothetical protein
VTLSTFGNAPLSDSMPFAKAPLSVDMPINQILMTPYFDFDFAPIPSNFQNL